MRRIALLSLAMFLVLGCSAESSTDNDTGEPDITTRDTATDTPAPDTAEEVSEDTAPDTPEEVTPDTTPDVVEDAGQDTFATDCDVMGTECEPSSIYCNAETNAVGFCSRCGFVLREDACESQEVCEVTDGAARCRPCIGDECPAVTDCEASTRSCVDYNTVQFCDANGRVEDTQVCPTGRRCFRGQCGSAGSATGGPCTLNIDPTQGCFGHMCVCGSEFEGGDTFCTNSAFDQGYCSTDDCVANGCDTDTEVCADFGISGALGGQALCITSEDCDRRGEACGPRSGFVCNELPGPRAPGGPTEWAWGCWPEVTTIGEPCASDSDCIGGECRTRDVGGVPVSYCVASCGADATCPSHSACVEDPDGPGHVCLALATSAACPRIDTEPLRISPAPPMTKYGFGRATVCYFAR